MNILLEILASIGQNIGTVSIPATSKKQVPERIPLLLFNVKVVFSSEYKILQ